MQGWLIISFHIISFVISNIYIHHIIIFIAIFGIFL